MMLFPVSKVILGLVNLVKRGGTRFTKPRITLETGNNIMSNDPNPPYIGVKVNITTQSF
jgi:hypothetical protein